MRFLIICFIILLTQNLTAQFELRGLTESLDLDCYQFTPDSLQGVGKIISIREIDLTEPVTIYTELFFGADDNGGEGIAFFFQSSNQQDLNSPFGLGMSQPSIAIEFDTYQDDAANGSLGEPSFDHIALTRNGDSSHNSLNNLQGPIIINTAGNVEDGEWHDVKIEWQPLTNTLSASYNCEEKINYQIDLINDVFEGNPEVFYGFSASSIQAQNQQQICVVVNTLTDRLEDVVLCQGGKTQINAVRGGERYNWIPRDGLINSLSASPIGIPSTDMVYTLEIQTGYCDDILEYQIEIDVNEITGPREFIIEDTTLCLDESITIDATIEENATSYAWSTGLKEPIETFFKDGRYDVTVTIDDECIVEDWVKLTFDDEVPNFSLGNDTTICLRSPGIVLKPDTDFEGVDFLWDNGSIADSITISRDGIYSLIVSNKCGSAIDDILVNSEDCRNFYIPNAFSPNDDGINDLIYPLSKTDNISNISSFKIYSRWGVLVHAIENGVPNSPDLGWDGTYRNKPVDSGVYVYEIILQFRDGQELLVKGDFTLVK